MAFTPLPPLLGGILLSVSTSSLLVHYRRVLGVSGIAHSVISDPIYDHLSSPSKPGTDTGRPWKVACFAGLLAGGVLLRLGEGRIVQFVGGQVFDGPGGGGSVWRTLAAGLLVGLGTKVSKRTATPLLGLPTNASTYSWGADARAATCSVALRGCPDDRLLQPLPSSPPPSLRRNSSRRR